METSGAQHKVTSKRKKDQGHQPTSATAYYAQEGDPAAQAVRGMFDPTPNPYGHPTPAP